MMNLISILEFSKSSDQPFKEKKLKLLLFLSAFFVSSLFFGSSNAQIYYQEEILGQPFSDHYDDESSYYARNIWDMKWFKGKLYLGAGNSSNKGSSINAGPVPIVYYEPVSQRFTQEGQVDDEQIDRFVTLNDFLYIPGHDPTQSWKLGNIYQLLDDGVSSQWKKIRQIPDGVHTYDLAAFGNLIFAALGTSDGGAISQSDNNGKNWRNVYYSNSRVYSFLQVKNRLYATTGCKISTKESQEFVVALDNGFYESRPDLEPNVLFPRKSLSAGDKVKVTHPIFFDGKSAYIGAYQHNDHQMRPFGFYIASSLDEGEVTIDAVSLPDGFEPWDVIIKDNDIFLLTNKLGTEKNQARIFRASIKSPTKFYSLFSLDVSDGFIRSFEEMDGYFYLSIGSEIEDPNDFSLSEITSKTGTLLRVKPFTSSEVK